MATQETGRDAVHVRLSSVDAERLDEYAKAMNMEGATRTEVARRAMLDTLAARAEARREKERAEALDRVQEQERRMRWAEAENARAEMNARSKQHEEVVREMVTKMPKTIADALHDERERFAAIFKAAATALDDAPTPEAASAILRGASIALGFDAAGK